MSMEKDTENNVFDATEKEVFEVTEKDVSEEEIRGLQVNEEFKNILEEAIFQNAEEKSAKKQISLKIMEILRKRKITKTKAVEVFKMNSLKVSALYRGKLFGFSLSRMIRFLLMLDHDIDIVIKEKSPSERFGHLRVVDNTTPKL